MPFTPCFPKPDVPALNTYSCSMANQANMHSTSAQESSLTLAPPRDISPNIIFIIIATVLVVVFSLETILPTYLYYQRAPGQAELENRKIKLSKPILAPFCGGSKSVPMPRKLANFHGRVSNGEPKLSRMQSQLPLKGASTCPAAQFPSSAFTSSYNIHPVAHKR